MKVQQTSPTSAFARIFALTLFLLAPKMAHRTSGLGVAGGVSKRHDRAIHLPLQNDRETRRLVVDWLWMVGVSRWDEKAGLRRDAVRSQVIDALEAQEIKETGNEED